MSCHTKYEETYFGLRYTNIVAIGLSSHNYRKKQFLAQYLV